MNPTAFEQFEQLERTHWWFRGRRAVYMHMLTSALGDARVARILDVGAGVGGFLDELSSRADEVHHTELSSCALKRCRARGARRGVQADAASLPYAEMSFDAVCLFDVLEHVEDHTRVLDEVNRVLTPEGVAVISVPAHPWLWSENDLVSEHVRRYTRSGLLEVIEAAQLVLERCTYVNAALFPAIAGFVWTTEAARRVKLAPRGATNLSFPMPKVVDELFYRVFVAELVFSRRWDLPIGHSLCAVVRRRNRLLIPVPGRQRLARASTASIESSLTGF